MKLNIFSWVVFLISALSLFLPFEKYYYGQYSPFETYVQSGLQLVFPIFGVAGILLVTSLNVFTQKWFLAFFNVIIASLLIFWGIFNGFILFLNKITLGASTYLLCIFLIFVLSILNFKRKRHNFNMKNDDLLDDF